LPILGLMRSLVPSAPWLLMSLLVRFVDGHYRPHHPFFDQKTLHCQWLYFT
jgi:hypothetical protein